MNQKGGMASPSLSHQSGRTAGGNVDQAIAALYSSDRVASGFLALP
jgi:hypothetical protein